MKKRVFGAFKRYNANTKNINKGDCSVRALSLAYGLEYADVYKELKSTAGAGRYNTGFNIYRFVDRHGGEILKMYDTRITVEEFSEKYPTGTYLLFTAPPTKNSRGINHVVALIDGNVYDSWNSLDQIVGDAYRLTEESTHLYSDEIDTYTGAEAIWGTARVLYQISE